MPDASWSPTRTGSTTPGPPPGPWYPSGPMCSVATGLSAIVPGPTSSKSMPHVSTSAYEPASNLSSLQTGSSETKNSGSPAATDPPRSMPGRTGAGATLVVGATEGLTVDVVDDALLELAGGIVLGADAMVGAGRTGA